MGNVDDRKCIREKLSLASVQRNENIYAFAGPERHPCESWNSLFLHLLGESQRSGSATATLELGVNDGTGTELK